MNIYRFESWYVEREQVGGYTRVQLQVTPDYDHINNTYMPWDTPEQYIHRNTDWDNYCTVSGRDYYMRQQ